MINPYAGVGGPLAKKGSDLASVQSVAKTGQVELRAIERAKVFLQGVALVSDKIELWTVDGVMGSDSLREMGFSFNTIKHIPNSESSQQDTQKACAEFNKLKLDLLIFVGGDGTARDVCASIHSEQVVLGVPAGVKMHSGVFAINPTAAARVVLLLVNRELNSLTKSEVRDIDEDAFRNGQVKSRYFGELWVPDEVRFVQQVKQGGIEVEDLVALEIADYLKEIFEPEALLIVGPGSTTKKILECWSLEGTLLGVDLVRQEKILALDVDADELEKTVNKLINAVPIYVVLTAIGAQGHIIGRGNQQIPVKVLRQLGKEKLKVVATKTKLATFAGRPLNIDSGDEVLDQQWSGYIPVITGYHDHVYYPIGLSADN